jgi:hypothetical protein
VLASLKTQVDGVYLHPDLDILDPQERQRMLGALWSELTFEHQIGD